ncbi:MAG: CapA family protein [Candidatus Nomurabacteria bacterium]|nr:CapA family protein [Candidatus Nomurabacteria bacterium]
MLQRIHPHIKYAFWIILSITIGFVFAFFVTKSAGYDKLQIPDTTIETTTQTDNTIPTAEQSFYFIKDANKKPIVSADAYFVGDLDTGQMIIEKNQDQKFAIASVSKLMTSTIATENMKMDDKMLATQKALDTYGKNGNFYLGEKIKLDDILYALLLESSNDAAEIIATNFGHDSFIQKMNDKAKDLGLTNTSFEDPSGLSENNKSTANELFKLAKYITAKDPSILERTKKQSYMTNTHNWFSNNQFIHEDGYTGGKSGYIDAALQTVVSTFELPLSETGNRHIAITLLHTPDRFKDVQNILKYLRKNVFFGKESDAQTSWVQQKEGTSESFDQSYVILSFVGDIMLDRGVRSSVNKNFNGDYSKLFSNLDLLKNEDIAFANLEGPASDQGIDMHNLYSFRMNPSTIPALKGAGFDVVSVANNHVGDWGRDAYTDTLNRLKENEISYTGGGLNTTEAENPVIIEKYGMKIGYLAFSDKGPYWMSPTDEQSGVLLANNPRFDQIIQNASKKVDYLVVSFHFGEEYQTTHNDRQAFLAHRAIDDGAKIIIGAHPHVVEDTEVYKKGFIAYSLGNFIFDQTFSPDTMQGMLLEVKLHKNGDMETTKNTVQLNSVFQPQKVIKGKEEKVKFQTVTPVTIPTTKTQ